MPQIIKTKVALVDADNCLVSNETGGMNQNLINYLLKGKFDHIWIFSGRNGLDTWRHVLKMGKPIPAWKTQLLINMKNILESKGLILSGMSLPYDHVFQHKCGDGYRICKLEQLESMLRLLDPFDKSKALKMIKNVTAEMDEEMQMQLAISGDMSKKGQVKYFADNVLNKLNSEDIEISLFDDLKENLQTVSTYIKEECPKISIRTFNVDFEKGQPMVIEEMNEERQRPRGP